ncbi:MAG TPA: pirin family protein [Nitrosopumilaceae archaeon]|nr:pirin family protein [Nitrosopumilaceae archaeon]
MPQEEKRMGVNRTISQIIDAKTTTEGDGFIVHRPFPNQSIRDFDPFLLLDEMGPIELSPGEAKGTSDHPHRGFETITYVIDGAFEHKDSHGNLGQLYSGDVQWMTAGSGVVHSEMPEKKFVKKGGRLHGFQLWVNLPKKDKMIKPRYQDVSSKDIPIGKSSDGKVEVKVIAGESMGKQSVIDTKIPIVYLHFTIQQGGIITQSIPKRYNAFAYVMSGVGVFGDEQKIVNKEQAVFFERDGEEIIISTPFDATEPLDVILLAGVPINEPIKRYGPFVMNTDEELTLAISDYKNGKMGKIDF